MITTARHNQLQNLESRARLIEIVEMRRRGYTLAEIGQRYGITAGRVCQLWKKVRDEWMTLDGYTREDLQAEHAEQLARLEHIKRVAFESFERSRENSVKHTVQEQICPDPDCKIGLMPDKTWCLTCEGRGIIAGQATVETKGSAGDPAFLRIVHDCEKERNKLLGFHDRNLHLKVDVQQAGGVTLDVEAYEGPKREIVIDALRAVAKLKEVQSNGEEGNGTG